MATKTFDNDGGGGDGKWNTAANWDPSGVPGAGDDVVIDADCTLDVNSAALGTVTVNDTYTLDLDTYDLTSAGTIDINGTLVGGSGTITITGDADFDYKDGTFTCETCTLDLQGTGIYSPCHTRQSGGQP